MGELTNIISGNPAMFKSADKNNIKSCKIYFGPIQDENGAPSPSNVKPIQGWQQLKYYKLSNPLPLIPVNFSPMELNGGTFNYLGDNTFFLSGAVTSNTAFTFPIEPFTLKKGHIYNKVIIIESFGNGVYNTQSIGWGFKHDNTNKQSLVFSPLDQHVNSWRTAGEWPLEDEEINACIISFRAGWSNVKLKFVMTESNIDSETISFPAVRKNLIDTNMSTSTDPLELNHISIGYAYHLKQFRWIDGANYVSNVTTQNNSISCDIGEATAYGVSCCLSLIPEETYCISATTTTGTGAVLFFDKNKNYISQVAPLDLAGTSFTVPSNTYYSFLTFRSLNKNTSISFSNIQLELGSVPTTYESPVHTLYGGYLDLIRGKLIQTHKYVLLNDANSWTETTRAFLYKEDQNYFSDREIDPTDITGTGHGNTYGVWSTIGMPDTNTDFYCRWTSASAYNFAFRYPSSVTNPPTLEEIKSLAANNQIGVVYKLATPIEYQLTPQQIQALLGENCILSDANEDIEVEYAFIDHLAKRKLILNEPHIETLSSPVCTFNTDMIAPLKECKLNFLPYQNPYSTPSPTNVVPIVGWNSIQFQTNRTLIPIVVNNFTSGQLGTSNGVINYLGNDTYEFVGSTTDSGSVLIPIQPITFAANTTYYVRIVKEPDSGIGSEDTSLNIAFKTSASRNIFVFRPNYVGWTNYTCGAYVTPTADYEAASLAIGIPEGSTSFKFKFFLGTSSFSPLTINWSSNCGTIYGGYVDIINGKLLMTHAQWTTTWGQGTNRILGQLCERRRFNTQFLYKTNEELNSRIQLGSAFCNVASWGLNADDYTHYYVHANRGLIYLPIGTDDNTVIQFCAELSAPWEYQLTPQQIIAFKGTNNIWSDANGTVDIKYWTH